MPLNIDADTRLLALPRGVLCPVKHFLSRLMLSLLSSLFVLLSYLLFFQTSVSPLISPLSLSSLFPHSPPLFPLSPLSHIPILSLLSLLSIPSPLYPFFVLSVLSPTLLILISLYYPLSSLLSRYPLSSAPLSSLSCLSTLFVPHLSSVFPLPLLSLLLLRSLPSHLFLVSVKD